MTINFVYGPRRTGKTEYVKKIVPEGLLFDYPNDIHLMRHCRSEIVGVDLAEDSLRFTYLYVRDLLYRRGVRTLYLISEEEIEL
jgi:hypothetical protein